MLQGSDHISHIYTFDKILGEGAFGVVKRAIKKSTGELFAVKIINKEKLTPEDLGCLQTEVEILTQVDHPNVVKLYEIYEDDTDFYMVLELMTGGELFERIVDKDHLSEREAAITLRPILDALQYCHAMGIVHRDLKPENLLYSSREPGALLKISDFGLARFIANNEVMMTQCGTPGYVAPEIVEGKGYNESIDFWSFGVILYLMLCGFPPFYDEDNEKLFLLIRQGNFTFPSQPWDLISDQAKDLLRHLLTTDPKKRYTATQILKHPWFSGNQSAKAIPNLSNTLKEFRQSKKMKVLYKFHKIVMKRLGTFLMAANKWKKI